MKLPAGIQGWNKIRDAQICNLWAQDLLTAEEIGERFGLTERRVQQILYKNRDYVQSNKEWERTKRKTWLKRQIQKSGDSKKDSADLMNMLRTEEEGNAPIQIDQSTHFHLTKLNDEELIKQARERRIPLPESIGSRIDDNTNLSAM